MKVHVIQETTGGIPDEPHITTKVAQAATWWHETVASWRPSYKTKSEWERDIVQDNRGYENDNLDSPPDWSVLDFGRSFIAYGDDHELRYWELELESRIEQGLTAIAMDGCQVDSAIALRDLAGDVKDAVSGESDQPLAPEEAPLTRGRRDDR